MAAGKVTFTVTNSGQVLHEMVVVPAPGGSQSLKQPDGTASENGTLGEAPDVEVGEDDDLHRHDEAGEVLAALQPPRSLRQRDVRGLHRELSPTTGRADRAAGLRVARTDVRDRWGGAMGNTTAGATAFYEARDFLLAHREDYEAASRGFRWPELDEFNWALDWFDVLAREQRRSRRCWIVEEDGTEAQLTFAELSRPLDQVAELAARAGRRPRRPDRC